MSFPYPTIIHEYSKSRHEELIQVAHIARLLKNKRKQQRQGVFHLVEHFLAKPFVSEQAIQPT